MDTSPKQAKFSLRGVFKGAGQSELKRNPVQKTAYQHAKCGVWSHHEPSRAWTIASSLVIAKTAPLEAVYASCGVALPIRATTEAVLITDVFVLLWRRNDRIACLHPYQTPFTCGGLELGMISHSECRGSAAYINILDRVPG